MVVESRFSREDSAEKPVGEPTIVLDVISVGFALLT